MRIDRLKVWNFRCFEHFTLELDPRCNVLIGENASGKTALLDAVTLTLEPFVAPLDSSRIDPVDPIHSRDIRVEPNSRERVLRLGPGPPARIQAEGKILGKESTCTRSSMSGMDNEGTQALKKHARNLKSRLWTESEPSGKEPPLPLVASSPTSRFTPKSATSSAEPFQLGDRLHGYRGTLRPETALPNLHEWMSWRTNANNAAVVQQLKVGLDPQELQSPELQAVTEVVTACIPGARQFFFDADHNRLEIEFDDERILPFSTLSSGYQSFLALVADLAWRCWQLNPHFGEAAPLETDGVVLIDEIDLHLHPAWQREVLGRLLEAFPKVQFVVTTHSPQVIASARPEWIRILDPKRSEAIPVDHVHGKDTNTILQQVMGVAERPNEMREKLDDLARKIDDDEFEEARELLDEIIEDLGDNDPKVVGLEWELSMARAGIHADD